MTAADGTDPRRPPLPLTWAVTLAFGIASFVGILALTSDLARTDATLAEGVHQITRVDETTTRGLLANGELPPIDAAVRASTVPVLATTDSLRRANATLTTLGRQVRALADVLTGARAPLVRTITTADQTDGIVRRTNGPTGHIIDTLDRVDEQSAGLAPALERTLRISRSIEAKLHLLGHLPGG